MLMTAIDTKHYVIEMLSQGFVIAPCANQECEQLFASDTYCSNCETKGEN